MSKKRRTVQVLVTLSYEPHIPAAEARRELRTRVNEGRCYIHDTEDVRVRKMAPPPKKLRW